MKDFNFNILQNCEFGMGALKKLPDILKKCGSDSVLLISDRGLESIGVVQKVKDIILAAGMKYNEYLDVVPNPTIDVVEACAKLYKDSGATSMMALGGGSPMDVATVVGCLAKYGRKVPDSAGAG